MREIFYPNSVAVVGVSPNPDNLGRNIVLNLIDFEFDGIVYAVGPRGGIFATRRISSYGSPKRSRKASWLESSVNFSKR